MEALVNEKRYVNAKGASIQTPIKNAKSPLYSLSILPNRAGSTALTNGASGHMISKTNAPHPPL